MLLRVDLRDAEEQMSALPNLGDLSFKPDLHHLAGPSLRQSHKDFWRLRFLGEPLPIPDWLTSYSTSLEDEVSYMPSLTYGDFWGRLRHSERFAGNPASRKQGWGFKCIVTLCWKMFS